MFRIQGDGQLSDEILDLLIFPDHRMLCFGLLSDVTRGEVICRLEEGGATLQEIADHFRLSLRRVHSLKALGALEAPLRQLFLEHRVSETRVRYLLALRQSSPGLDLEKLVRLAIRYQATGSQIRAWAEYLRQSRTGNPEQALRRITSHRISQGVSKSKLAHPGQGGGYWSSDESKSPIGSRRSAG